MALIAFLLSWPYYLVDLNRLTNSPPIRGRSTSRAWCRRAPSFTLCSCAKWCSTPPA